MSESLSVIYCPRCQRSTLHATRGTHTACQACDHTTAGGRTVVIGKDLEDRKRARKCVNSMPVDEVAP